MLSSGCYGWQITRNWKSASVITCNYTVVPAAAAAAAAATTTRRTRGEISEARAAVPGGHREVFSTLTTRGDRGGTEPWSQIGTGGSSNVRGEHR